MNKQSLQNSLPHLLLLATAFRFAASSAFAEGDTFSTRLYESLSAQKSSENFIYSPYSISEAFRLASFGARGETLKQIQSVLNLDHKKPETSFSSDDVLAVANRVWIQKGFALQDDFLNQCKTIQSIGPGLVDFEKDAGGAIQEINQWVETQTHEKIKNLIPAKGLGATTRLVLTNAIYFKGKWLSPFQARSTRNDEFTPAAGKSLQTPFMHQVLHANYSEDKKVQVLELLYQGAPEKQYAMTIVLPKNGVSLAAVEKTLSAKTMANWKKNQSSTRIDLALPKFEMTSKFSLQPPLTQLGLRDPFLSQKADFSGIDGKKDLFISEVFHKAFVKVDEEGTEAAAATATGMFGRAIIHEDPPILFAANKPFLFYISEMHSDEIIFMGKIMNPNVRTDSQ